MAVNVISLDFSKTFDTEWVYSLLDKELTEWPSPESGGEWS